jgi:hypothetical protein
MHCSDDLIILDLILSKGDQAARTPERHQHPRCRLMILIHESPGENFPFGQGEAQRVNAVAHR